MKDEYPCLKCGAIPKDCKCDLALSGKSQTAGWAENGCSLPVGDDCPVTGIPCNECGFGQPNKEITCRSEA
jgi:hypothetical protein